MFKSFFDVINGQGTTSTLASCAEFQSIRAFALLAVLFAALGATVHIAKACGQNEGDMLAGIFHLCAAICGLISWVIW